MRRMWAGQTTAVHQNSLEFRSETHLEIVLLGYDAGKERMDL